MKRWMQCGLALGIGLAAASMQAEDPKICPAGQAALAAAADGKACCAEGGDKACCAGEGASTTAATKAAGTKAGLVLAEYKVSGMTCAACEGKLTAALAKMEGVSEPSACATSGIAKVAYDPKKVKESKLLAAIQGAGFKVEAEMLELQVDGMSCGACSGKVSQALTGLPGVKSQEVCHESKKAVVTFDPAKLSREKIIAAIDQTGFKVAR